ncbi:tetratricopeptide repeat protein, partial [Fusobacterium polymorphum]|uniref:tetratricopeptide repeat protein n=1 Tax=Fusobacterium nucleatum subsp. polymorphum TaxID=76857 RepID=UPI00300BB51F
RAIELNPNNASYYYNRGNTFSILKEYEKAIDDYSRAIELNPNNASYYYNRGISFNRLKEYEKAIDDYNKAIELNPNDASYYYNRGNTFSILKEYEKAIDNYSRAIELNPNNASYYYNRGNTFSILKEYEKAIDDYNKAIELNPNNASYYYNRGNTFSILKEYEKAIDDYSRAIDLNPNDASYYYNRGNTFSILKEYEKAIDDYNKAIELNPNNASYYYNRGNTFSILKEYEKAIDNYEKAIELDPNNNSAKKIKNLILKLKRNKNFQQDNKIVNTTESIQNIEEINEENKNFQQDNKIVDTTESIQNIEEINEENKNFQQDNKIVDTTESIQNIEERNKEDNLEPNFISDFNEIKSLYLNGIFKETKKKLNLFTEKYKEDSKKEKQIKILLKEVESIRKFLESGQEVLKGYLTFADILGWKGIWKKQNSEEEKVDTLNTLLFIKSKLEEEFKDEKENYKINLISDTYVVFAKNFQINNKLSKRLIELCLKNDLLIRGATSYGKFYNNDMVYIGQTVDEAASWHEMGEEIGIFYTSSAKLSIDEENPIEYELKNSYLRKGTIKTKLGEIKTYYINWYNKETKKDFYRIMKDEVISPDISSKYLNTEKSMEKHLNVKSNKILRSNKYVKNR